MRNAKPLKAVLAILALACSVSGSSRIIFRSPPNNSITGLIRRFRSRNIPAVRNRAWVKTPVDAFVLAKLESEGARPTPAADKITLLRRATFDLTGLPPTPEEVNAFLADNSPGAFEKSG